MVNNMSKVGGIRNSLKIFSRKTEGKRPLERPRLDEMINLKCEI
jgi:hypothetical protein